MSVDTKLRHELEVMDEKFSGDNMVQMLGMELSDPFSVESGGTMAGHVGFAESVGMICDALGWDLEKFEQDMEPIVTDVDRKSPYGFAAVQYRALRQALRYCDPYISAYYQFRCLCIQSISDRHIEN